MFPLRYINDSSSPRRWSNSTLNAYCKRYGIIEYKTITSKNEELRQELILLVEERMRNPPLPNEESDSAAPSTGPSRYITVVGGSNEAPMPVGIEGIVKKSPRRTRGVAPNSTRALLPKNDIVAAGRSKAFLKTKFLTQAAAVARINAETTGGSRTILINFSDDNLSAVFPAADYDAEELSPASIGDRRGVLLSCMRELFVVLKKLDSADSSVEENFYSTIEEVNAKKADIQANIVRRNIVSGPEDALLVLLPLVEEEVVWEE